MTTRDEELNYRQSCINREGMRMEKECMSKSKTYTAGANAERTAILSHVRRQVSDSSDLTIDGNILIARLKGRNERYNRRKGGLGKMK